MGFMGLIIGLAVGALLIAAVIYYFQFGRQSDPDALPQHTPYVQQGQAPVQPAYTAAPSQPVYAPNQVVYTHTTTPGYAAAPTYGGGAPQGYCGGIQGGNGGGISGASVAVGAAAGLAGGLVVGGLISGAGHSSGGGGDHGKNDDSFAGDF